MNIRKQSFLEFLVIGFDEDKQKFFCDLSAAASKQAAVDKVSSRSRLCDRFRRFRPKPLITFRKRFSE